MFSFLSTATAQCRARIVTFLGPITTSTNFSCRFLEDLPKTATTPASGSPGHPRSGNSPALCAATNSPLLGDSLLGVSPLLGDSLADALGPRGDGTPCSDPAARALFDGLDAQQPGLAAKKRLREEGSGSKKSASSGQKAKSPPAKRQRRGDPAEAPAAEGETVTPEAPAPDSKKAAETEKNTSTPAPTRRRQRPVVYKLPWQVLGVCGTLGMFVGSILR